MGSASVHATHACHWKLAEGEDALRVPTITPKLPRMFHAGLIPADGDVWKARRRAVVPSLHRKYIENMVRMFGDSALHGVSSLQQAHQVWLTRSGFYKVVQYHHRQVTEMFEALESWWTERPYGFNVIV